VDSMTIVFSGMIMIATNGNPTTSARFVSAEPKTGMEHKLLMAVPLKAVTWYQTGIFAQTVTDAVGDVIGIVDLNGKTLSIGGLPMHMRPLKSVAPGGLDDLQAHLPDFDLIWKKDVLTKKPFLELDHGTLLVSRFAEVPLGTQVGVGFKSDKDDTLVDKVKPVGDAVKWSSTTTTALSISVEAPANEIGGKIIFKDGITAEIAISNLSLNPPLGLIENARDSDFTGYYQLFEKGSTQNDPDRRYPVILGKKDKRGNLRRCFTTRCFMATVSQP
jgi:hypothetical protein